MVDTTSSQNLVNQDIVAAQDRSRINSAADKWWSNMLAVVKLRQKGTTIVSKLPSGVFRYMLEYKFPNEFRFRYSEPLNEPSESSVDNSIVSEDEYGRHFPAIEKLSYDNYLVTIYELPGRYEY